MLCWMTRAEKVYLTYSNTRTMWGGIKLLPQNRFIGKEAYLKEIKIHRNRQ